MQPKRISIVLGICILAALTSGLLWPRPEPAAARGIAAVSAGGMHSCILTTAGGVKCWGMNEFGQLGNGTTTHSALPVDVVGLESGVVSVAAGAVHTCAVTTAGGVKCWGSNGSDQLGDGTSGNGSNTPVDVVSLESGAVSVNPGGFHTCAITTAGGVKCWGLNEYGQLGNGTTTDSPVPVDVAGLDSGVTAVSAGDLHACAVTAGGGVKCWGQGAYGQLGATPTELCDIGTAYLYPCSTTPLDVTDLASGVAAVAAAGSHTCALTAGGGVKCWGNNNEGELGNGTTTSSGIPVDVVDLDSGVTAVSANNGAHTCALTLAGGVKCWGFNFFGQVGDGTSGPGTNRTTPVDVVGRESGIAAVAAGAIHTCALTTAGGITCWGSDYYDQLGDSDGDGCTDFAEYGSNPEEGGLRDPFDPWDYFNPTGDGENRVDDIQAEVGKYGVDEGEPGYSTDYDRGAVQGPNRWDLAPPDGLIRTADILAVVAQYGHDCSKSEP